MGTEEERYKSLLQQESEIIDLILDTKSKYRKIVQAGISQWIKDFQDGKIKIKTVDDLKKLIELDVEMQKDDIDLLKIKKNRYSGTKR